MIGLETMPRTMDNIGFYSRLGFVPGRLTITLTLDAAYDDAPRDCSAGSSPRARDDAIAECRALVQRLLPGYDYTREIDADAGARARRHGAAVRRATDSSASRWRTRRRSSKGARARSCAC